MKSSCCFVAARPALTKTCAVTSPPVRLRKAGIALRHPNWRVRCPRESTLRSGHMAQVIRSRPKCRLRPKDVRQQRGQVLPHRLVQHRPLRRPPPVLPPALLHLPLPSHTSPGLTLRRGSDGLPWSLGLPGWFEAQPGQCVRRGEPGTNRLPNPANAPERHWIEKRLVSRGLIEGRSEPLASSPKCLQDWRGLRAIGGTGEDCPVDSKCPDSLAIPRKACAVAGLGYPSSTGSSPVLLSRPVVSKNSKPLTARAIGAPSGEASTSCSTCPCTRRGPPGMEPSAREAPSRHP